MNLLRIAIIFYYFFNYFSLEPHIFITFSTIFYEIIKKVLGYYLFILKFSDKIYFYFLYFLIILSTFNSQDKLSYGICFYHDRK